MKTKKPLPILLILILAALVFFLNQRGAPAPVTQAPDSAANQKAIVLPTAAPETDSKGGDFAAPGVNLPTTAPTRQASGSQTPKQAAPAIKRSGAYTSAEDVALYLYTYGELPSNFITKDAARNLGWSGGDLRPFAAGKTIGGDRFGNYEGLLPKKQGRVYYECDIDTLGKASRGAKRIVYSNDGLIYYTADHYESFTLLYGED